MMQEVTVTDTAIDRPTQNVSISDPELRAFVREQAEAFFGGNISRYIVSLISNDRDEGHTRRRMLLVAGGLPAAVKVAS